MAQLRELSRPAVVRWRLTPWWARVLVVFGLSRMVTTVIMLAFAAVQARANGTPVPDYFAFASNWDGQWYWYIASAGYPPELPTDAFGHVLENAWAFMPVYPFFLGIFLRLGFPFPIIAVLVTLAAGACAALLFERLLRHNGFAPGAALFGVVLLCTAPLSPMFQVTYAEAPGLALLFLALLLVQRGRFWMALPVIVVMAFTRPSGLAFALFLLLYFVMRIVRARREPTAHPLPRREVAGIVVAGLTSAVAGFAWPAIAWAATGRLTAYTDTELAWRAGYVGYGPLVPFQGWFQGMAFWIRFFGAPEELSGALAIMVVVLLAALFVVLLFTSWARRLGVPLRLWLASYAVYIMAVFFPQSSTWRLLLPLSPALGALALPTSRVYRVSLVLLGIAGQVLWVHWCWWREPGDWSPP